MAVESGTASRLSLSKLSRMLNMRNRDYDKVQDMLDTRVPLHNDEAFQHGIKLKAKFIGSLEITKPSGKMDIITAMRKIRYEYKSKGIKKIRSQLEISTAGVKVTKRRRMRRRAYTEAELLIMQHPIYRIFYVSHDSQDLKIFSYITREVADNTFRCNVFKAYKNSMALHIVRSLGQAFEVCHKLNPRPAKKKSEEEEAGKAREEKDSKAGEEDNDVQKAGSVEAKQSEDGSVVVDKDKTEVEATGPITAVDKPPQGSGNATDISKDVFAFDPFSPLFPTDVSNGNTVPYTPAVPNVVHNVPSHQSYASRPRPRAGAQQTVIQENPFTEAHKDGRLSPTISLGEALGIDVKSANPFGAEETDSAKPPSLWLMEKQQLCSQLALLGQQLQAETTARMEAQAQVHHLLTQNKELLAHMQKLILQIQQLQLAQAATPLPSVQDLLAPIDAPVTTVAT